MSKELLQKAQDLGIQNAENLTPKQLGAAVKAKENANLEIILKATALGLETEGKTLEELAESVKELEDINAEIAKQARDAELLALLSEYLGIEDIDSLSKEEVIQLLEKRKELDSEGVAPEPIVQEGKTDESVKASNGSEYVFKEDAPAVFRYLNQFRTQKEWIADKDAIDLMVAGRLSFLTLKK